MPDGAVENVSDTAFWVAYYRAMENDRPDALFPDPLAARLAGDHGRKIASSMPLSRVTAWTLAIRTVIIDGFIKRSLEEGVDTIINLGAGLDTRPYRMELPSSLLWIEADYPKMIAYKEERLANERPRCRVERVRVDLSDDAARRSLLARIDARAIKMLVLTEGVIPYLSNEQVASLAGDLHSLNHVCYWIAEYFSPDVIKFRERAGVQKRLQNAPFKFRPDDWFGFFVQRGWYAKETRYLSEEGKRLRRPVDVPLWMKMFAMIRAAFASKVRREHFRKFSAYILLAPGLPEGVAQSLSGMSKPRLRT
ncbi:MAG TPA: SAM-dependent methyltransferase [Candidatus Acidoferrales bacterium]|nr:SAM-dependent methyltransferase [Candidatus Acidoferrales bacterium]